MDEVIRSRPEIALDDFLPIFLSSSMVLVFGALFVGIYTLVKMGILKKIYTPLAYLFWILQAYCMYFVAIKLQVDPIVGKILAVVMIAYLTFPHLYYYLTHTAETEEEYENQKIKKGK